MNRNNNQLRNLDGSDVRKSLVQALADVGADPAFLYAFRKTGVYVSEVNQDCLAKEALGAFTHAIWEYHVALNGPVQ